FGLQLISALLWRAIFFACFMTGVAVGATVAEGEAGGGRWGDAARWGGAAPGVMLAADIEGAGRGTLAAASAAVGRLDLGASGQADASLTINGGTLAATEFVRLGEYDGSRGKLVVNGGRICTTEIGIGGMNGGEVKGTPCEAEMEVRGGL